MYVNRFAIDKELNVFKRFVVIPQIDKKRFKGACHGDDLYYLFR